MRLNLARLDALAVVLLAAGVLALAASVYAAAWLLTPPTAGPPPGQPTPEAIRLAPGQVATILHLDHPVDSAAAAQPGDHVDVLGYFSRQVTGGEGMTRVLLNDVAVLGVGRDGPRVALTLAVPQEQAALLREAQTLGVRPFVALRSAQAATGGDAPSAITDRDLAARLVATTQRPAR